MANLLIIVVVIQEMHRNRILSDSSLKTEKESSKSLSCKATVAEDDQSYCTRTIN